MTQEKDEGRGGMGGGGEKEGEVRFKVKYQLDVTCFIISLFNAQHVSDVNTSIRMSGACDLFVELFHGLYCSGSMCAG